MTIVRRFVAFANENYGLSAGQVEREMNHVYARGDRLLGYFILGHIAVALVQGLAYQTWSITLPVTFAATAMFFASVALLPGTLLSRYVAGIVLQTFCALHIYQMHGLPEMHFYFFTAQTMMIVYEDWRATWPGTWLIIGQHILFAVLQNTGSPLYFFPDSYITVRKLTFHFGIALVQVLICTYWALLQRRHRLHALWQNLEIEEAHRKAQRATEAKSQFLANMSHEIRTPMNGVLGMTDVLLGARLTPDQRDCAMAIQSSGESLLSLLDGILDISKIEAGRMELEPVEFRLREVLEGVGTLLAAKAAAQNLELVVRIDPEAPAKVIGDPTRLRQVLLNLTGNALKFTHQGHVLIDVSPLDRNRLRFRVSDTGIGIPPEKRATIFDRFSQADESTTRRYGGTGLGLSISQELVGLMGGRIEVRSAPGEGACFEFELSFPMLWGDVSTQPLEGARVLLVDGRALSRSVLAEMIEAWGASVTAVTSLEDAGAVGQYSVAVAQNGSPLTSLPVPLLVLCGVNDRLPPTPDRPGVRAIREPVRSAELLDTLRSVLNSPLPDSREQSLSAGTPMFAGMRVLVAEDNAVNQRVAAVLLERLGCKVDIAVNGARAVEMWRAHSYDVVFMDCQMPELDGLEATAEIRRAERSLGRHTPIIAMTANAMAGDRERCLQAGMDGYLAKPVKSEQLKEALMEFVSTPALLLH